MYNSKNLLPFGKLKIIVECNPKEFEANLLWIACATLPSEKVFNHEKPNIPLIEILAQNEIEVIRKDLNDKCYV